MQSFTSYLFDHKITQPEKSILFHQYQWLENISKRVSEITDQLIHPNFRTDFSGNLSNLFNHIYQLIEEIDPKDKIACLDGFFPVLSQFIWQQIVSHSLFNPQIIPDNSIVTNISGVTIEAYFSLPPLNLALGNGIQSDVGNDGQKKTISRKKPQADKYQAVDEAYSIIEKCIQDFKKTKNANHSGRNDHAEDNWFTQYLSILLISLVKLKKEHSNFKKTSIDTKKFQDDPTQFLTYQGHRLNFVLKTAPCDSCKELFSALRKYLNVLNIQLPIYIYSYQKSNGDELNDTNMFIVDFDGKFINTNLSLKEGTKIYPSVALAPRPFCRYTLAQAIQDALAQRPNPTKGSFVLDMAQFQNHALEAPVNQVIYPNIHNHEVALANPVEELSPSSALLKLSLFDLPEASAKAKKAGPKIKVIK